MTGDQASAAGVSGIAELHAEVGHRLAAGGQRYPAVRRQIVEALAGAARPLSVADLIGSVPDLAMSSAYRNLAVLSEVGAVARVATEDDAARFELAEAITEHHHHHLVCTGCGLVLDYEPPPDLDRRVAADLEGVAQAAGFVAETHRLDLFGRCAECAAS